MKNEGVRGRRMLLLAIAVGLAIAVVGGWAVLREPSAGRAIDRPVSKAEAEALLERTVELARASEYGKLCGTVTDQPGECRALLDEAKVAGYEPDSEPPTISGSSRADRSLILHLRGQRPGGGNLYAADFAVTRDRTGRAVAYTPIYWSGVLVNAEPIRSCSQRSEPAGCATEAPPPIRRSR